MTDLNADPLGRRSLLLLWSSFLQTFLEPPPERVLTWNLVPSRPRLLRRAISSEVMPWLALIGVFGIAAGVTSSRTPWAVLVGALAIAPLLLIRRSLLIGWRVGLTLVALAGMLKAGGLVSGGVEVLGTIGLPLLAACVALSYRREIGLWAWAATILAVSLLIGAPLAATVPLGALVALLTDTLRSRRLASIALADQQEITGQERARRIGVEERTRVARELHDIVAHHMSMVAVRAETAPFRLSDLDDRTRTEFEEISQSARESLNEIRSLLSVLRRDEAPRMPQPGVEQIGELVESARSAGAEVELTIRGEARPLRPAVEVCAYRIVQESLANVTRHAVGAGAGVWLEYRDDALEVMVANPSPDPAGEAGHGITGMQERVAAVGGTFDARRRADGRFVVEASLPVGNR